MPVHAVCGLCEHVGCACSACVHFGTCFCTTGDNESWVGPNAEEWQQAQQQLSDHQQRLAATQQLLMASQQQQQTLAATVQQMQMHYDGLIAALRVSELLNNNCLTATSTTGIMP